MIVLFRICPAGSLLVIDRVRVSYDVFFRIVQDAHIRRRMIAVSQHDLLQVLRQVLTVFAAEIRRLSEDPGPERDFRRR